MSLLGYEDGSTCVGHSKRWYIGWDEIPQACGFWNQFDTKIQRLQFGPQVWNENAPPIPGVYYRGPISPHQCVLAPSNYSYRAWTETIPHLDLDYNRWTSASFPVIPLWCEESQ